MSFTIISDVSKQYLLEEDAIKGFRMAVENGQARLALQILTDIIDVFADIFAEALSDEGDMESALDEQKAEKIENPEKKITPVEEVKPEVEEKQAQPKSTAKKETKTSE